MFPLQESPDNIPHFRLWNLQSSFASVLHLSRQSRLYLSVERCAALEKVVSALSCFLSRLLSMVSLTSLGLETAQARERLATF